VPPDVAAFHDMDVLASAAKDDHAIDGRIVVLQRFIDVLLQGHHRAAAIPTVGGDDQRCAAIEDAVPDALGAETTEDNGVDRADPCASEHGDGSFRHHRHVNDHAMELAIGEGALFVFGLTLPDDRGFILARGAEMAVEAVLRDVEFSAHEPFRVRFFPIEDLFPFRLPLQFGGFASEKLLRLVDALFPELAILFHRADAGFLGKLPAGLEDAFLDEMGLDVLAHGRAGEKWARLLTGEGWADKPKSASGNGGATFWIEAEWSDDSNTPAV
jgi:hypothetical protein